MDREKQAGGGDNVLTFRKTKRGEPPLSNEELRALRALLENAQKVAHGCPVARRILGEGE